jgi:hypothetical protein
MWRLPAVLLLPLLPLSAETVLIQIRVLEGEGAVNLAGAKASRPITVLVVDETGKPVEGAGVTFRLPEESPTGFFDTGLKSEIQITGPDGRASAWGVIWGDATGPVKIRVTATKDLARAGTIVSQYVTEKTGTAPPPAASPSARAPAAASLGAVAAKPVVDTVAAPRKRSIRWWVLGMAAGGAVAAAAVMGGGTAAAATPNAAGAAPLPTVSIGPPSVSVGRP